MKPIALFDVDYTLTQQETQVAFIRYLIKKDPKKLMQLPRSLYAGAGYLLGLHDEKRSKELNLKVLKGLNEDALEALAKRFFKEAIQPMLYRDGLILMRRLYDAGYRIILNSASPQFYIKEFEASPMVEKAMGSRFKIADGCFTAQMDGANNKGAEKVRRLKEYLGDDPIDWQASVAYSDSLSDAPMLDLVGKAYLINHKPTEKYPVLTWR